MHSGGEKIEMQNFREYRFLRLAKVTKQFFVQDTLLTILHECTYDFQQGISYAIMGASGSGKSTLLHSMAGLDLPTSGSVEIGNCSINALSPIQRASTVSLVTQTPYFIGCLTALENVCIAGIMLGMDYASSEKRARSLMDRFGIGQCGVDEIGALSGGQRQRLSLARALMNVPKFLLADELTGNLDSACALDNIAYLKTIQKEEGVGIILVTHSFEIAQQMDTIIVIENGKLKEM